MDVKTDCGCVVVEDFTGVVKSGSEVSINADISISHESQLTKQLILRGRDSQGGLKEIAYLIVNADIHQPVTVRPAKIDFRKRDINEPCLIECSANLDGLDFETAAAVITGRWIEKSKIVSQTEDKLVFEVTFDIAESDHSEREIIEAILMVRPGPGQEESKKFLVPIELSRQQPLSATPSMLLIDEHTTTIKMVLRGDFTDSTDDITSVLVFSAGGEDLFEVEVQLQRMSSAFGVLRWRPSGDHLKKLFSVGSGEIEISIQQQTIAGEFLASHSSEQRGN